MFYTITAFTENKPGVLYRIADLFLRRQVNIESLSVREIDPVRHVSRFTIEIDASAERAALIVRQMERIVEVERVELASGKQEQNGRRSRDSQVVVLTRG